MSDNNSKKDIINDRVHPNLIDACENLMMDLAEAHTEERDAQHYGDEPEKCVYCRHLKEAEAALKLAKEKIDIITVEVSDGRAYCDDPRVEIIDHDDIERKRG